MSLPAVLVVEDDERDQYVLKILLQKFDFHAEVVSTAEEAMALFEKNKYAVILLDLSLPGMNGYDCAKRLREIELDASLPTPIIALTARTGEHDQKKAKAAGMNDFITKPFAPEALRKVLLRYAYEERRPNLKTLRPLTTQELNFDPQSDGPAADS